MSDIACTTDRQLQANEIVAHSAGPDGSLGYLDASPDECNCLVSWPPGEESVLLDGRFRAETLHAKREPHLANAGKHEKEG